MPNTLKEEEEMNFKLSNPTRLYFGNDALQNLASELKNVKRLLLVYGGGSIKKNGLYDDLMKVIQPLGIEVFEVKDIPANPTMDKVNEGKDACIKHEIDYVLGVGGGSVIDCTKAIAFAAKYEGDFWDVVKFKKPTFAKIPFGTVLTTTATSSENNPISVISNTATLEKHGWSNWPLSFPNFSILDAKYTLSVGKEQTMYGIVDIMAHMIENYFHDKDVNHPIVKVQDREIESMLREMIELGPKLLKDLSNLTLREGMMYIGSQALSTKYRYTLNGDWASHLMEHAISAVYNIPHAGGLSILLPHWMTYIIEQKTSRSVKFARDVFKLTQGPNESDKSFGKRGIEAFTAFLKSIEAPLKLSDYGIDDKRIDEMVDKSFNLTDKIGGYVSINKEDVKKIYLSCL